MPRNLPKSLIFAAGIGTGLAGASLFGLSTSPPKAQAQPPAVSAEGRFWISSYGTGTASGAYIIDTESGDVFALSGHTQPRFLGTASKPPR